MNNPEFVDSRVPIHFSNHVAVDQLPTVQWYSTGNRCIEDYPVYVHYLDSNIIPLLASSFFVPSGAMSACHCPRWHPDGNMLVISFHRLNMVVSCSVVTSVSIWVLGGFAAIFLRIIWTVGQRWLISGSVPLMRFSVAVELPSVPSSCVRAFVVNSAPSACLKCILFRSRNSSSSLMAPRVNPFWALSCSPAQDSSRGKVRRRTVVTCESHEFGPAQSSRGSSSLSVDPTLTPSCE